MDYLTIHINKKVLLVVLSIVALIAGYKQTYKSAYDKGMRDMYTYIMDKLNAKPAAATDSSV